MRAESRRDREVSTEYQTAYSLIDIMVMNGINGGGEEFLITLDFHV